MPGGLRRGGTILGLPLPALAHELSKLDDSRAAELCDECRRVQLLSVQTRGTMQ
jgi:hypothetical protein